MIIGVTDTMGPDYKFQRYLQWLMRDDESVQCERLSYARNNLNTLDKCLALVLTGGNDVDPLLYHRPGQHQTITDVDRKRDDFERAALDKALRSGLPVLGICRGLQLANVHLGGTLMTDIEEAGYPAHRSDDGSEKRHDVAITPNSWLQTLVGVESGTVNTSHHQATETLGTGLSVAAKSPDGVIEAIELKEHAGPFFLLVQWHPERMTDIENPLSGGILERFFSSVRGMHEIHHS